jgi:hypothetical protein
MYKETRLNVSEMPLAEVSRIYFQIELNNVIKWQTGTKCDTITLDSMFWYRYLFGNIISMNKVQNIITGLAVFL